MVVPTGESACDETYCYAIRSGIPYVVDKHHLAAVAAESYAESLERVIAAK